METSISRRTDGSGPVASRRAWTLGALAVAAAVMLAVGIGIALRSSWFDARDVQVSGQAHLSRAYVVRRSGVNGSTNAIWLDEGAVERRLEQDPWIERASVSTSFPWTVHITVTERIPVAIARQGSSELMIAGDGTPLGLAAPGTGLPVIVLPAAGTVEGPRPSPTFAARALGALPPQILSRVRRVEVALDGTLELRLTDGLQIEFGTPTGLAAKARSISSVLAWADAERRDLAVLNVAAPAAPAAKLAG